MMTPEWQQAGGNYQAWEQLMMQKMAAQQQAAFQQQTQAYQAWAKANPKEAAALEKAYKAQMDPNTLAVAAARRKKADDREGRARRQGRRQGGQARRQGRREVGRRTPPRTRRAAEPTASAQGRRYADHAALAAKPAATSKTCDRRQARHGQAAAPK